MSTEGRTPPPLANDTSDGGPIKASIDDAALSMVIDPQPQDDARQLPPEDRDDEQAAELEKAGVGEDQAPPAVDNEEEENSELHKDLRNEEGEEISQTDPEEERANESQDDDLDLLSDFELDDDSSGEDEGTINRLGDEHDNAVVSVTVDGELVEVPLSDLKKRYAGEGAIDRRVQEATEARTAAIAQYEQGKTLIENVMHEFGAALLQPTIPVPPESLRQTDPTEYLIRKDAYDAEQTALQERAQKLHQITQQADQHNLQVTQEIRDQASSALKGMLPILGDAKKGPKVKQHIVDTAKHFGYTDTQIAGCVDPNLFHMAYWAARGLAMARKGTFSKVPPAKPRSIPTKGTSNKPRATTPQRQQAAAVKRARTTGSVDDVAATMINTQRRRPS